MTYALWIIQGLLALIFLFAGEMKLVQPIEALTAQMPLPGPFVRLIGVAEALGAIGLILPGLPRIRLGLTPLAAATLVINTQGIIPHSNIRLATGAAILPRNAARICASLRSI